MIDHVRIVQPSISGRVFCLGGNYAEHQKEMGQAQIEAPTLFVKVPGSLVLGNAPIYYPPLTRELHYEGEIVWLMGPIPSGKVPSFKDVIGLTAGLDLTRRDLQTEAKRKGKPWEMAKSWPGSARLAPVASARELGEPSSLRLITRVNGELRQSALFSDMILGPDRLLPILHAWFPLKEGDLIFTGTPKGVGPIVPGDVIGVEIEGVTGGEWRVLRE